ncbi:extracellular calcium-sensing receptor-like, partial [Clarias magur]
MPSDEFQIKALAKLVHYFQWTWVGVIGVESDYARFAIQLFLKESARYRVCPAYVHFYPVTLTSEAVQELMGTIKASRARVILNFSGESEVQTILRECRRQNITHVQWIASEAWATSQALLSEFHDLLQGTLGFAIRKGEIPDLGAYLKEINSSSAETSHFLAEFWQETFNCRLDGSLNIHIHSKEAQDREACSGKESLDNVYSIFTDVSQLRVSYNVYKAVYLIAHALHEMSTCVPGQGPFQNGTCGSVNPLLPSQ